MLRIILSFIIISIACNSHAQMKVQMELPGVDTLQITFHDDEWVITHVIQSGETVFNIAQKYHVPPVMLADANGINFQTGLQDGEKLYVPFGPFNKVQDEDGSSRVDARPLKYVVRQYDNLYRIAHLAGVSQKTMQEWNGMSDNYIEAGQVLFVGWVLYEEHVQPNEEETSTANNKEVPAKKKKKVYGKTVTKTIINDKGEQVTIITKQLQNPDDTLSPIEKKYKTQTRDELVTTEEKGTAVFFQNKGKVSGTGTYFAFHNSASVGTIIKVHNPGTNKTVYVKVLGPIPDIKQYHNSIIGISDGAKKELFVSEDKVWCELTYAP